MSEKTEDPTLSAAKPAPVRKTTWRVFRREADLVAGRDRMNEWIERPQLEGEGWYGWTPTARDVGNAYGAGEYLLIECPEDGGSFTHVHEVHVVAETTYREYREEDDGSGVEDES